MKLCASPLRAAASFLFLMFLSNSGAEAQDAARYSLTLDARAWATLTFGVEAPLGDSGFSATASLSAPVFRLFDGDPDTWEASAGLSSSFVSGDLSVDWGAALTFGATDQTLGSFAQFGTRAYARPAWNVSDFSAGVAFVWEQGWLTRYEPSEFVKAAFDDRYANAAGSAASGWFLWGSSKLLIGPDLRGAAFPFGSWRCAGGLRLSPGSLVGLSEGFPIGEWPFWFELGWSYP